MTVVMMMLNQIYLSASGREVDRKLSSPFIALIPVHLAQDDDDEDDVILLLFSYKVNDLRSAFK